MLILTWVLIVAFIAIMIINLVSLIKGKTVSERIGSIVAMVIHALVVYVLYNNLNCLS